MQEKADPGQMNDLGNIQIYEGDRRGVQKNYTIRMRVRLFGGKGVSSLRGVGYWEAPLLKERISQTTMS